MPGSADKYLALFNARDPWVLNDAKRIWQGERVTMETPGQKIAFEVPAKGVHTLVLRADDGDTDRFWWPAVWAVAEPVVLSSAFLLLPVLQVLPA